MDTVKEYLGYINPHWIAVVVTGMYIHLRQICVIGLCFDEESTPFDPSYASVLFVFSVLCLLAEYRLWPRTLKEPPIQLLYIYEVKLWSLEFEDFNTLSATVTYARLIVNENVTLHHYFLAKMFLYTNVQFWTLFLNYKNSLGRT